MKHRLLLDDIPHDVWLVRRGDRYLLIGGGGGHDLSEVPGAVVAVDGDVVHIHLDGRAYVVRHQPALDLYSQAAEAEAENVARAPMPGSVVAVQAQEGDPVCAGDTLLIIESMKLETAIKAARDGVVETLHVGLGQTFERDALLVTLAPRET
ncbi:acetyl-CoA carboxylase biotin carboxyl carrier protein subunit [Phenylobacterium sp.]|jgi:acetyl/propionyl-CoA carboxylase alpha subunit|uniref:acetyl-CoA carboxylase biotin carboxyl carrier protein subunit n=1 Tax=Phenylobacterium sp. TaxID=1871053 RepID=UPI002F417E59